MPDSLGDRTELEQSEAERRWAIRSVLVDHRMHCEHRHRTRPEKDVWPSQDDIADQAIERLDRLYTGAVSSTDMIDEINPNTWVHEKPGGPDYVWQGSPRNRTA